VDKNACFVLSAYAVAALGYAAIWLHSFFIARKKK